MTDVPYGIGEDGKKNHSRSVLAKAKEYTPKQWDKERIDKIYFDLMSQCSKNQIIFGGNYYTDYLLPSSCWIVWDKNNGNNDFADCELAWTSFKTAVRMVKWTWNGMLQENMANKEIRIHPTQKPVGMIEWVLNKYTKEGDLILDPFSGSASISIACRKLNRNYIACELDKEYYDLSIKRMNDEFSQLSFLYE